MRQPDIQVEIESEIEEIQRLRGWFVNSYAQVEYLLGAFIVTSMGIQHYQELGFDLPHRARGRINRIRKIVSLGGPLAVCDPLLEHVIGRFEKLESTRNLLAHGFCKYLLGPNGERAMRFKRWHREKGQLRPDMKRARDFRVIDLRAEVRNVSDLAEEVVRNLNGIEDQFQVSFDR